MHSFCNLFDNPLQNSQVVENFDQYCNENDSWHHTKKEDEIKRLKEVIQAESDAARLEAQRAEAELTALRKELDKAYNTKEALSGIIRSCTGSSVLAPCLRCGGWHKYNSESSKKPFYCIVCSST